MATRNNWISEDFETALVSVIIPTYNRQELLEEAIQSVLNKLQAIECIIVDDGSTDETKEFGKPIYQ